MPTVWRIKAVFLSTPSGWRATGVPRTGAYLDRISIHALRVEGDFCKRARAAAGGHFYPRPPGGGRPCGNTNFIQHVRISIHALRVEGDRRLKTVWGQYTLFLSTPSGWRATVVTPARLYSSFIFLSTPSGWRATVGGLVNKPCHTISIHALRVEGDTWVDTCGVFGRYFYPRPPGGGRRLVNILMV